MNKRSADATTATATETASSPAATDVLSGIEFTTPMLRLAKTLLGPFLRHGDACTADACACGLSQAVAEIKAREIVTQRYGSDE